MPPPAVGPPRVLLRLRDLRLRDPEHHHGDGAADERHGERLEERRGDVRKGGVAVQPGPAGQDHHGALRDHLRRQCRLRRAKHQHRIFGWTPTPLVCLCISLVHLRKRQRAALRLSSRVAVDLGSKNHSTRRSRGFFHASTLCQVGSEWFRANVRGRTQVGEEEEEQGLVGLWETVWSSSRSMAPCRHSE